jgi:hypothetical protein
VSKVEGGADWITKHNAANLNATQRASLGWGGKAVSKPTARTLRADLAAARVDMVRLNEARLKAEAEVERLDRLNKYNVAEGKRLEAEVGRLEAINNVAETKLGEWRDRGAEMERLRGALVEVLDYAGQLELVAYEQSRECEEHPIMARARAALSWEEISTASVFGSASDKQDDDFCGDEEK